jgi:hypothetical protein
MTALPCPIVLLTSHADPDVAARAVDAGVLGFLVKPLRNAELGPALDVAVTRFGELEAVRKENEALKQKLESRKLVDRAKGLLMTRMGLSEPEAFRRIQKTAMDSRKTMADVAQALLLADGRAVIVDRGWVPFEMSKPPVEAATPRSGSVEVTGVLEPTEPPGSGPKAGPVQLVTTVDLPRLGPQMPYPLLPMYVRLRSQVPAQSGSLPAPAPLPPLTEGPYQGYMLQWFAFATIFLGGYCVLVWREARDRRASHTQA